jgi:sporulation protein YlmC with PRC-barrel domain
MTALKACDLQGKLVRTRSGQRLGHVDELSAEGGAVKTLICGKRGLLQRFTQSRGGRRVDWERVVEVGPREIVVED